MAMLQAHDGRGIRGARARSRVLTMAATILLASFAGTVGPADAQATGTSPATSPDGGPALEPCVGSGMAIVADMETMTPEVEAALAGIEARMTEQPDPTDSILFVVSLVNGPMPPLREQLAAIEGKAHGRAAILLTRARDVQDAELNALVVNETRELLAAHGQPGADTMPFFLDDDPNLDLLLRGLAASS